MLIRSTARALIVAVGLAGFPMQINNPSSSAPTQSQVNTAIAPSGCLFDGTGIDSITSGSCGGGLTTPLGQFNARALVAVASNGAGMASMDGNSGGISGVNASLSGQVKIGTFYAGTPCSVAAGATIAPICSFLTLTGATTTVSTMTPPAGISGAAGFIDFVSVNNQTLSSSGGSGAGQFALTVSVTANTPYHCIYGLNSTTLWYCK